MWVAPLVYVAVSLLLWKIGGALFMPELLANRMFEIFPVPFIEFAVQLLGPLAKELAFYGIAIGYFGAYFLFAQHWDRIRRYLGNAFYARFAIWGIHVLILIPAAGQGVFASRSPQGALTPSLMLFASHWMFARSLQFRGFQAQPVVTKTGRRIFIVALGVAGIAALVRGYRFFFKPAKWSNEITPTEDFYKVSKNSVDPVVPEAGWKLGVRVANETTSYTLTQLRDLPSITMFATLACISNPVGGDWLGNARWTGVPLAALLQGAGIGKATRDVVDVIIRAADGYSDSIPIDRALQPFCFLAYEMKGAPLTTGHGFPLRLIVPGIYGMKNVKWITSIELADSDYRGFWQRRGWDDVAHYKLMSRIDIAKDGFVAGVAFAGDRGVDSVQVRIGDEPWRTAELRPALSPITWVLWSLKADVKGKGVIVRMKSSDGEYQIAQPMPPFPEGSSGLHTVKGT
jgi:DMSO/TMAO reductase YedYZ molybdopterin-dependent catalytic subunit